jgi:hypothetical protein
LENLGSHSVALRDSSGRVDGHLPMEIFQDNSTTYIIFENPSQTTAPYRLVNKTSLEISYYQKVFFFETKENKLLKKIGNSTKYKRQINSCKRSRIFLELSYGTQRINL